MPEKPTLLTKHHETLSNAVELRDEVAEMLALAQRLRESSGADLDDASIEAVSELTGASMDFVRVALRSVDGKKRKPKFSERIRTLYLSLDPDLRTMVTGASIASGFGLAQSLSQAFSDPGGVVGVVSILLVLAGVANCSLARSKRIAAVSGAITGAAMVIMSAVFLAISSLFVNHGIAVIPMMLVVYAALGAVGGSLAHRFFASRRTSFGLKDPVQERQELLVQLMEIQDRLHKDRQAMSFVSIDMVGSTRIKMESDPLAVEFTFNEFHKYTEAVIKKHGGHIHSTAGDGVTAAFDQPQQAFAACRHLQSGLIELNTHRNRLNMPITLRIGLHHGEVLGAGDGVANVNFSHVIDVAAHLQKACPPGAVVVSEFAASGIEGGLDSVGHEEIATQGVNARCWRPRASMETRASLTAPPALPS